MQQKQLSKIFHILILQSLHRQVDQVDKLDIDKSVPVPDLSKLSHAVRNDVFEKAVYDKFAGKLNNIDTSRFVLKTKCYTDKTVRK